MYLNRQRLILKGVFWMSYCTSLGTVRTMFLSSMLTIPSEIIVFCTLPQCRQVCGTNYGPYFPSARKLPMNENEFLWHFPFNYPSPIGYRIRIELPDPILFQNRIKVNSIESFQFLFQEKKTIVHELLMLFIEDCKFISLFLTGNFIFFNRRKAIHYNFIVFLNYILFYKNQLSMHIFVRLFQLFEKKKSVKCNEESPEVKNNLETTRPVVIWYDNSVTDKY